jgi:HEAT repeat protein
MSINPARGFGQVRIVLVAGLDGLRPFCKIQAMNRCFCVWLAAMGALLAGCSSPELGEPSANGYPLSHWMEVAPLTPDRPFSEEAEDAIQEMGTNAVPHLVKWIQEGSPEAVKEATAVLGELGPKAVAAVSPLSETLASGKRSDEAATALARIGPPALPVLMSVLTNRYSGIHSVAARAIGSMGPDASPAIPTLIAMLRDDDWMVKSDAFEALNQGRIDPDQIVPELAALYKDQPDGRVEAVQTLAIYGFDTEGRSVIPSLVKALKSNDFDERRVAAAKLVALPGSRRVPVDCLIECLTNSQPAIRVWAHVAVTALGSNALPAIPVLLAQMTNANPISATAYALGKLKLAPDRVVPFLADQLEWYAQRPTHVGAFPDGQYPYPDALVDALGEYGPQGRAATPVLKEIAMNINANLRRHAARALTKIEPQSRSAF